MRNRLLAFSGFKAAPLVDRPRTPAGKVAADRLQAAMIPSPMMAYNFMLGIQPCAFGMPETGTATEPVDDRVA
ncbi:MAG: hypothetical protein KJ011_01925 [Burkholderiaceae bacterium]|nr:hypothetical protein [Burkholderiaceae bacterium]